MRSLLTAPRFHLGQVLSATGLSEGAVRNWISTNAVLIEHYGQGSRTPYAVVDVIRLAVLRHLAQDFKIALRVARQVADATADELMRNGGKLERTAFITIRAHHCDPSRVVELSSGMSPLARYGLSFGAPNTHPWGSEVVCIAPIGEIVNGVLAQIGEAHE